MQSCHINDGGLRRCLISTENKLPHIVIPVAKQAGIALIKALYDTGGPLNIGTSSTISLLEAKCRQLYSSMKNSMVITPFDPIKLSGALLDPDDYDAENTAYSPQ